MATVYLAHDLRHDRKVALKVLKPELAAILGAERFLAEIKTTANLQHPHILSLFDSGEAGGFVYYVMPYVEGESLRDRLTRERQLPVEEAVRIAREVADALQYAHEHGVVHRDIKPENILLHGGHAQVADFGIALAASRSDGGTRMTETGMSLGTPHYMSPEQAMGEREITARSDVYALGCVLYEMLTGEPPFTGPTAQAIVARMMTEEPRSITLQRRTVPPHVEAATFTALARLPADRFASAREFVAALDGAGGGRLGGSTISTASRPSAQARSGPPLRALAMLAAPLVVALAGLGYLRLRASGRPPVTRQYLFLGDSVQMQPRAGFALSPDGSALVFVGDSLSRLWIKRRSELNPALLPGTDRATGPVFSPDGQWIAYVADGSLRKRRVDGGTSVTLADSAAAGFATAAWMDDGTIAFISRSVLGLRRVSAVGGSVSVVLADSVMGGLGLGAPTALPHGRGVLFQACTSGCATMSLHVVDLRTGREKELVRGVAAGWYLPSGHLLYVRPDGVTLVVPFDLERLATHGEAVPVLEGVAMAPLGAELAWAPAGTLVYGLTAGGSNNLVVERVNRSGAVTVVDSAWSGLFNAFALSPDGRRVAVGAGSAGIGNNIWIKQLEHGPFTRLTFTGRDRRPAWSPDGRMVAFVRDTAGGGDVYARAVDGSGEERRLTHLGSAAQEVVWSPDGRWIVVRTDNSDAGNGDIVGVSTSGDTTPVRLVASPFTELHPAVSPDGRWLAYSSNEAGTYEVYVRPFPKTETGRWQVSTAGGTQPVWSRDGRELFFLDGAPRLIAARLGPGPGFSVVDLKPLFSTAKFINTQFHQSYDAQRDGRLLFSGTLGSDQAGDTRLVQVDGWLKDLATRLAP